MSGGSFDYAYSKIDELCDWVGTLNEMASRCRDWASSVRANTKHVNGIDVATTLEDRACILVRAMLLERAAERLRLAIAEVQALEDVMHDVEWVAYGSSGAEMKVSRIATRSLRAPEPKPVRRWTPNPDAYRNECRRRKGLQIMLSDDERSELEVIAEETGAPLSRVVAAAVSLLAAQTLSKIAKAVCEAEER